MRNMTAEKVSTAAYSLTAAAGYLFRASGKLAAEASPEMIWEMEMALDALRIGAEALGFTLAVVTPLNVTLTTPETMNVEAA